jgi:nucleotide-binding universal stress UspA family protein
MFSKIMIPVDLGNTDQTSKALGIAADLAKRYDAQACIVGIAQTVPTKTARTPEVFNEKLLSFAAAQSEALGITFAAHSEVSHDITIDLDTTLTRAAQAIGADLIVMASHVPGLAEYVFASNAGYLASHANMSVFVVR